MEHFKNPYDTRIKEIDDVLDKRFGEAKTAGDWEKRVKALEAEQAKLKEGGDDFSYYKKAIFDAKKKKAENMDDGSLEEQRKKIKEFEALREEEDKGLLEKIATMRTDEKLEKSEKSKKLEELEKDRNKKLAYYEKKINEVEDKIKPKSEEEFVKKIEDVEERRTEKLRRIGLDKDKKMADITYFDKQIADAQRELDKQETFRADRPIQFVLEAGLKEFKTHRDIAIIEQKSQSQGRGFDSVIRGFAPLITTWRRIESKKPSTAHQWQSRKDELILASDKLDPIFSQLFKEEPQFQNEAMRIWNDINAAINKQIEIAEDEIEAAGGVKTNTQGSTKSSARPSPRASGKSAIGFKPHHDASAETRAPASKQSEPIPQPEKGGVMDDILKEMADAQKTDESDENKDVFEGGGGI